MKIFSSIWLHFKKCFEKYFLMFGCVLENTIFYLLFILSHIFSAVKQIYNIIHSSIQKHKQNPEKNIIKSSQIDQLNKKIRSHKIYGYVASFFNWNPHFFFFLFPFFFFVFFFQEIFTTK